MNRQHCEWLETNGAGGFACGCVDGQIRRFWHGLLWTARNPPADRIRLAAGLSERLHPDVGEPQSLSAWLDRGIWREAMLPAAFAYHPHASWSWKLPGGGRIERGLLMHRFQGLTIIRYDLADSNPLELGLSFLLGFQPGPLVAGRKHRLGEFAGTPVFLHASRELQSGDRIGNGPHRVVHETELECEDEPRAELWTTDEARLTIEPGAPCWLALSDSESEPGCEAVWEEETSRRGRLALPGMSGTLGAALARAADSFIVRRADGRHTIMAGYPWFTDWGRDTMIALPGVCLRTGRFEEARSILGHFLAHTNEGLIPNLFPESGTTPQFNTIDATLWLFEAVFRYMEASGDRDFVREVLPALECILACHERGTLQDIRLCPDGLLRGGTPGSQLTWMDVKVNGEVPTPRHGKPVEIQGLWYNALRRMAESAPRLGLHESLAGHYAELAAGCAVAFPDRFAVPGEGHLADVADRDSDGTCDVAIRPNMVLPFALRHNVIPEALRPGVLRAAARELLTPRGLRSLAPGQPHYHGSYRGGRLERDRAYHQGTVWMWLIGPFVEGVCKEAARVPELAARLGEIRAGLTEHFDGEGCLGSASEIFDADPPHQPRGGFAQAWSVSAMIEVMAGGSRNEP
ncbi:glycogen debranching enzyme N-terminal domain-containing protein [Candidatus Poribacteria bacterium]|nr:glycogen debranching enzyme N-terminal domain-containing protein [Candidatus Poribacteria bacterium]